METAVIDTELEEFAKTVGQSKALHYDMDYINLFLKLHSQDLRKVLETRKIKTVFNCLNRNGVSIRYDSFCRIVAKGALKEKTKCHKKESTKIAQSETPIMQKEKKPIEKQKSITEIRAEAAEFARKVNNKPSAFVQKQIDKSKV
jgi:leucyl aminopeptidase